MNPRVLHIVPNLLIGGAQRTIATLSRAPHLDSRVVLIEKSLGAAIAWSDVVVLHAWRRQPTSPDLNVPEHLKGLTSRAVILFNHDWEGRYDGIAKLVLVYSNFAAAHWQGPQRLAVLPGGITLDRFSRVAALRNWSRIGVVGRLSTLHPGKISPTTIASWGGINAGLFLVGGTGSQLSNLIEECTDSRFRFVGEIQPRLTHEFLERIDIFLYETEWHIESFGYVLLEALAAGCVVVSSNRGAIGELIQSGVNGYLFNAREEAVALCNTLLGDPFQCRAISEMAALTAKSLPSDLMRSRFTAHVLSVLA
jgi:glycosyltransferase involved in cell wall biosynthesis